VPVDRGRQRAEQPEAERPAELVAGLGEARGRAGPLGRGGADDKIGAERRGRASPNDAIMSAGTSSASPAWASMAVSSAKPRAEIDMPAPTR
jgi:hypothetical protein